MRTFLGLLRLIVWRLRRLHSTPKSISAEGRANRTITGAYRPHVLVVTPFSVHPLIHGGAVRIANLIRRMARSCDVSLLILSGGTDDPDQRHAYMPWCRHVFIHHLDPNEPPAPDPWNLLPPSARPFSSPHVADRLAALVDAHRIDIVQLELAELAAHVQSYGGACTVLDEQDLGFATQERQRAVQIGARFSARDRVGQGAIDGFRQERFEVLACERADQVYLMSGHDRDQLARRLQRRDHLRVIPNGVDTTIFRPPAELDRCDALFVGSFPHLPNLDAFEFLMAEIWPAVRRRYPGARLTVAGARPPEIVTEWNGRDGVRVVGEVDEIAPLYRRHRVLVAPLRAGSGTRLKILEAMASGLPVVATTIGAEGIELGEPPEIVIADNAVDFAVEIAALLAASDERISDLGRRGRTLVERKYDWNAIARELERAYFELLSDRLTSQAECAADLADPSGDPPPEISVIIVDSSAAAPASKPIDAVARQRMDRSFEIIWVTREAPSEPIPARGEVVWRIISAPAAAPGRAALLTVGARAARGRILVFLSHRAVPVDDRWLDTITAPFDTDPPPMAVCGGIVVDEGSSCPFVAPRIAVRWSQRYGGISLSTLNAAIRRDAWERIPFPPDPLLADQRWQRLAAVNRLAVIQRPAAVVRLTTTPSVYLAVRSALAEGRAWRRLGARAGLVDLAKDLIRGRPVFGAAGDAWGDDRTVAWLVDRLRALALFLGARLPFA